jgi:hypothetical protein
VYALEAYARALRKPFIYGKTSHAERTHVLGMFKNEADHNVVFLSKVCCKICCWWLRFLDITSNLQQQL